MNCLCFNVNTFGIPVCAQLPVTYSLWEGPEDDWIIVETCSPIVISKNKCCADVKTDLFLYRYASCDSQYKQKVFFKTCDLVFVILTQCVFCEVRTLFINVINCKLRREILPPPINLCLALNVNFTLRFEFYSLLVPKRTATPALSFNILYFFFFSLLKIL
jgi:hypothetical protein